jgi:hypothetical protein
MLYFEAPNDVPLVPGIYTLAERFPFQAANKPGLWIAPNGYGPNTITGEFTVLQAIYDVNGTIQNFGATYIQFPDNSPEAMTGHFYYNYDAALVPRTV